MARMPDIEAEIRRDWERLRDTAIHITHATQTPGSQPVNLRTTTTTEDHMALAPIEDQVRNDLSDGIAYAHDMIGRLRAAAPGILATVDAIAGNPTLAKLAETAAGRYLPPGVEEIALSMLAGLFASHGQPVQATEPVQQAAA